MSKYRNIKVIVNGIKFDSKREARRYEELKLLERAKEIKDLKLQPKYELIPAYTINKRKIRAINYVADFEYKDTRTGEIIVEDVKGVKTEVYKIKKKIFGYKYKREIQEI